MQIIFRTSQNDLKNDFAPQPSRKQNILHQVITDYDYSSIFRSKI